MKILKMGYKVYKNLKTGLQGLKKSLKWATGSIKISKLGYRANKNQKTGLRGFMKIRKLDHRVYKSEN